MSRVEIDEAPHLTRGAGGGRVRGLCGSAALPKAETRGSAGFGGAAADGFVPVTRLLPAEAARTPACAAAEARAL
eukprot:3369683-Pleurochrysis_carterae.AAC.1